MGAGIAFLNEIRVLSDRGRAAGLSALVGLGAIVAFSLVLPTDASAAEREPEVVEGSYVVVYKTRAVSKPGAETRAREQRHGFESEHVYRHSLKGFAAELNRGQVRRLENDREVKFVAEDKRVHAAGWAPKQPGEGVPPTGVRRIRANKGNTHVRNASTTNVAVIDTGVKLDHPDLNVKSGRNCVSGGASWDGNGHGTHVAGSIAAKNNGLGIVGVAPGTLIYAVKVLDDNGDGLFSDIVCGIDYVTARHDTENIGVVNMSLGGGGDPVTQPCYQSSDPMHFAICRSTAKGVDYVVAAGNDGWDYDFPPVPDVPAAYPEVLTVTAMSDSDGRPGGTGPNPTCRGGETDDAAASFSNFVGNDAVTNASAHTIAGPGVCINSTWIGSPDYETISGTSMASPHIAGLVALCHGEVTEGPGRCAPRNFRQVIRFMVRDAENYNTRRPIYGFDGDPLHSPVAGEHYGFLARALPPGA